MEHPHTCVMHFHTDKKQSKASRGSDGQLIRSKWMHVMCQDFIVMVLLHT